MDGVDGNGQAAAARPTLDDVAEKVGLSTRTVSRVLRNEGGFSSKTEQRVRQAIDELGYYPNLLARGLKGKRSGTIGLVGPGMSDPFFAELADELQRAADGLELKSFSASTFGDPQRQDEILRALRSYGVDGVVIHPCHGTGSELAAFAAAGTSTVALDQDWHALNLASISADRMDGARVAVDHLITRGRRSVAMINGTPAKASERADGYRGALPAGYRPIVIASSSDFEGGRVATTELLSRHPAVDGIFAYNDLMALGAVAALDHLGRRVPGDVAVVGYDDILAARVSTPALTTVRHDRAAVASQAVEILESLIAGEGEVPSRTIPVSLVVRATT